MSIMKKAPLLLLAALAIAAAFITPSCNKDDSPTAPATLYDSLGGTAMVTDPTNTSVKIEQGRLGIRSVVDSTIFVIAADTIINPYFAVLLSEVGAGDLTGFEELSKNLTDFLCVATGAKNFTYTGLSMTDAHNPAVNPRMAAKAGDDDFDEFIADVVVGAHKNAIPDNLIGSIGTILETLRSQVVQQ